MRKSKMGFSLQRVQRKLNAEESKLEMKSLKDKRKSSNLLATKKRDISMKTQKQMREHGKRFDSFQMLSQSFNIY